MFRSTCAQLFAMCGHLRSKLGCGLRQGQDERGKESSGDRRPEMVMVQTADGSRLGPLLRPGHELSRSRGLNFADVLTFIKVFLAQNELCMRSFTFQRFLPFIGAAQHHSTHWCFNHMLRLQATWLQGVISWFLYNVFVKWIHTACRFSFGRDRVITTNSQFYRMGRIYLN